MNLKIMLCRNFIIMSLLPSVLTSSMNIKQNKKYNYKFISSLEDLKDIYPDDIIYEDLKNNLKNNKNISEEYKEYTNEFIDLVEEKYPDFDLTIFNENIKQFKLIEKSKKEIQNNHPNRQAFYRIPECTIYIHDEFEDENLKKYCFFHELWHMFNNLYVEDDNKNVYYKSTTMYDLDGTALDEGITTFLTESIYSNDILCYTNQYDEVKILYQIYGDQLLTTYIDSGIDGIEFLISETIGYTNASNLISYMNQEEEKNYTIKIYETLIQIYLDSKKCDYSKSLEIYQIIENSCYDIEIKKQLLKIYKEKLNSQKINNDTMITFDESNYYNVNDLYFVDINDEQYLINDEILISYYKDGYIKNIYELDKKYIGISKVIIRPLKDYLVYSDNNDNIIYININQLKELGEKKYVKSK